jgi:hypothetical protein
LGDELLSKAYSLIIDCLKELIVSSILDEDLTRIKIILKNNITIFIIYNDNNEYSYVIVFSLEKFDRIRFDNYDKLWDVKSKPHHCHPRFSHNGTESEFVGIPENDMPLLCEKLKDNSILSK